MVKVDIIDGSIYVSTPHVYITYDDMEFHQDFCVNYCQKWYRLDW